MSFFQRFFILFIIFVSFSFGFELQNPMIYNEKKHNINNWVASEKLDGIRAFWDGKKLYTKNKNEIFAPEWFTKDFPPFALDGELWTKHEDFEKIQSIVLSKKEPKEWETITYNIFELPEQKGNFFKRLEVLSSWLKENPNKYIKIVPQKIVKNSEELNNFLNEVLENKSEGLIVKNPNLEYFWGRSYNILKVKRFLDDEAKVLAINYKKDGTLKSLKVELKSGITFLLGGGFKDEDRENPPKIGDIVTFKYLSLTKQGKPKFASFLRVRTSE